MKKTHHCNELRDKDLDKSVALIGWVDSVRDHGGVFFIDLRDREGKTQIVLDPQDKKVEELLNKLKTESVISVEGVVKARPGETVNTSLATGAIEVVAKEILIHNLSETPPFPMDDEKAERVNEDLRLQYRYLDLRRPSAYNRLLKRHKTSASVREYLNNHGFLDIELPILFKSTPEGAREFLVPSRLNPGEFYALSQSPQQYKQMLMVAGIERYYSIAKCFRDEDLRADRQPEFTQIDLEMSFIDREDIYTLIEGMMKKVWKDVLNVDIPTPFKRMPYHEAMNRFGVDKPDTRFGVELQDLSELFKNSEFKVFSGTVADGGVVKAINVKGLADITQGELKSLEDVAKGMGAKGLAFIKAENDAWKSPILKFLSEAEQEALKTQLNIENGDIVFFAAMNWERACSVLGRVRLEAAQMLVKRSKLELKKDQFNFLWVIDFPLMIFDDEAGRYLAGHHPFTAPVAEDEHLLDSDPLAVRGQHYDLVVNGWELGGGSIRIHNPELQKKVFEDVLKIPKDIVEAQFGYMLKAFKFGAPPHGGIAFGLDRLSSILTGANTIREVIAFPKTQKGQDLMSQSPSKVTEKQLTEVFIGVKGVVVDKALS